MRKLLLGNEKNIERDCFFWNTLAGLINAAEAVVMSMVLTRTIGLEAAGIVAIAFAVGNLMMTVGKFNVRNYQVTDTEEKIGFGTYFSFRILTSAVMVLGSAIYIGYSYFVGQYSTEKAIAVGCICAIYVLESVEDVFWGRFQQKGRLDVGGRIFSFRWGLAILVFSICAVVSKNLTFSMVVMFLTSVLVEIILLCASCRIMEIKIEASDTVKMKFLFGQTISLFLAAFLSYYISNSPKYAIDRYLTDSVQACYGFVSMPVFVIELLNNFLYQPILVHIATEWNEGKLELFKRRIWRQMGIIFLLTIVCIVGAFFLGIPVLSMLYSTDLTLYKAELLILLLGGGMLAFVGFFMVLLTIMRKQKLLPIGYLIAAVLALFCSGYAVQTYGSKGAAVMYTILMSILALIFGFLVMIQYRKKEKERV